MKPSARRLLRACFTRPGRTFAAAVVTAVGSAASSPRADRTAGFGRLESCRVLDMGPNGQNALPSKGARRFAQRAIDGIGRARDRRKLEGFIKERNKLAGFLVDLGALLNVGVQSGPCGRQGGRSTLREACT